MAKRAIVLGNPNAFELNFREVEGKTIFSPPRRKGGGGGSREVSQSGSLGRGAYEGESHVAVLLLASLFTRYSVDNIALLKQCF